MTKKEEPSGHDAANLRQLARCDESNTGTFGSPRVLSNAASHFPFLLGSLRQTESLESLLAVATEKSGIEN
jgi:hypothetical protein